MAPPRRYQPWVLSDGGPPSYTPQGVPGGGGGPKKQGKGKGAKGGKNNGKGGKGGKGGYAQVVPWTQAIPQQPAASPYGDKPDWTCKKCVIRVSGMDMVCPGCHVHKGATNAGAWWATPCPAVRVGTHAPKQSESELALQRELEASRLHAKDLQSKLTASRSGKEPDAPDSNMDGATTATEAPQPPSEALDTGIARIRNILDLNKKYGMPDTDKEQADLRERLAALQEAKQAAQPIHVRVKKAEQAVKSGETAVRKSQERRDRLLVDQDKLQNNVEDNLI